MPLKGYLTEPTQVSYDWLNKFVIFWGLGDTSDPVPNQVRLHYENGKFVARAFDGTKFKDIQPDFDTVIKSSITSGIAIEFDGGHSLITAHDGSGNFSIKSGVDENHLLIAGDGGSHIEMAHSGVITLSISKGTEGGSFTDDVFLKINSNGVEISGGRFTINSALNLGTPQNVTISGNTITVGTSGSYIVDTEGGGSSDYLDTINGGNDGEIIILSSASDNRDITVRDSVGNIKIRNNFNLTKTVDTITLMKKNNLWVGISSSNNAD
jgi:hypothetical protein